MPIPSELPPASGVDGPELQTSLFKGLAQPPGTSDEWRHYTSLYFPYVAGIRPYSRRPAPASTDGALREAAEWFAAAVPERTLHNWQNEAARLIAGHLRELDDPPA